MADLNANAFLALASHWLVLWLGMYLVGRRSRSASSVLIGVALMTGAVYLLGVAYCCIPATVEGVALREQWLAGWVIFSPPLFVHGFMELTGFKPRWRWWALGFVYAFALAVFVGGFFGGVFYEFEAITLDAGGHLRNLPVGQYYWIKALQVIGTLLAAIAVLLRARFARPAPVKAVRRQLGLVESGMVLMFLAVGLIYLNGPLADPIPDALILPVGLVGTTMMAVPLVRYAGGLGGQLLGHDAWGSLLVTLVMLAAYLAMATAVGASVRVVAGTAWLMVVPPALGSDLRAATDRLVYGQAGRAARAGLRTAEAYAGTSKAVDLDAIRPEGSGEVVDYLSHLDRVAAVSAGRALVDADWLKLLAREEFAAVRQALEIPSGWKPGDPLSLTEMRERMAAKLLPRERQALGLWYLGHSDKDMARLMGVKPNVPRSYLSEGKHKVGLPSGPPLMLFVHFAGFVSSDALPLF